jgi:hypothetical protein
VHLKQMSYVSAALSIGQFIQENDHIFNEIKTTKNVQSVPGDDKGFQEAAKAYDAVQRTKNIADAKKFGVKDPEAILAALDKASVKWKALSKDIGTDIDKFAVAIQREIYDKVDLSKL